MRGGGLLRRRIVRSARRRRSFRGEARRGADAVRDFVTEALGHTIVVDLTRKQMSGDKVRWRVRTPSPDPGHAATGGYRVGQAEATFDKGKISTFSLGPRP